APPRQGGRERRKHRRVGSRRRRRGALVAPPDQEPVLVLAVEPGRNERPDALEALAGEANGELAVLLLLDELVGSPVPDLARSRPVLPGRNLALEARVVERMILDVHGERAAA